MKPAKAALFLILSLFLTACRASAPTPAESPHAVDGKLDLSAWDFEDGSFVALDGDWAFYWDQLLTPDQIPNEVPTGYVAIPSVWEDHEVPGETFTPEGYATYHLTLTLPRIDKVYGFFVEGEGSAYTIWVDGIIVAQNGQVGETLETMTPEKVPLSAFFHPEQKTVEIVIQVSNFHHRKGGFRNSLILGLATPIHDSQFQRWFVDAASIGILFIISLYHLFIFVYRSKDRAALHFTGFAFLILLRIGVTNQYTLLRIFSSLNWDTALRLEYLTFYSTPIPFVLFMQSLYPKEVHRWFVRLITVIAIAFILPLVFLNTLTISYIVVYYQYVLLFEVVYYLIFVGRIVANKRDGALYIAGASLIVVAAMVIESLSLQNILPYGQIAGFSFLAFIFVQAVLLSSRLSRSFERVEYEQQRASQMEQIAQTDPLTQIYNRRYFYEQAVKELHHAQHSGDDLALVMLDIDHFKNINDSYGHLTGDQVLINLVDVVQRNIRNTDLIARFGGEEFVILMPNANKRSAVETAERLRQTVSETPILESEHNKITITISLGVANWDHTLTEIDTLLDQADQALYQSKQAGRNRVTAWGD